MTQPTGPSYWNTFDQGIHQSAKLATTIQAQIAILNGSTDYSTIESAAQTLLNISAGTDPDFSLLDNSRDAQAFMAGLQPAVMATLSNYQVTVDGSPAGNLSQPSTVTIPIVDDNYHSDSPDASQFSGDFPAWLQNDSSFNTQLTSALNNAYDGSELGSAGRDSFTYVASQWPYSNCRYVIAYGSFS